MGDNVVISHRGAAYEIGRGRGFYGIWPAGAPRSQPAEWWPATPAGWSGAWSRFTRLEAPAAIVPVTAAPLLKISASTRSIIAAVLLAVGVVFGVGALFPGYLGSPSLASQASELVPHLVYLATWLASTVLILLGGTRLRVGALLAAGTSAVTFGLYFADLGTAVSGSHLLGAGLVLGLVGWLCCAVGAAMAVCIRPDGEPAAVRRYELSPLPRLALIVVVGVGVAATFAAGWDSYTLRTAAGQSESFTLGNAFDSAGAVIAGDVMVMIALVAVLAVAAMLRPVRHGAVLLAGAALPMVAQAISAIIQLVEPTSPAQFGISPAQAALSGLTVKSGATVPFWVYCILIFVLVLIAARMLLPRRPASLAATAPVWPASGPAPLADAVPGAAAPGSAGYGPVSPEGLPAAAGSGWAGAPGAGAPVGSAPVAGAPVAAWPSEAAAAADFSGLAAAPAAFPQADPPPPADPGPATSDPA